MGTYWLLVLRRRMKKMKVMSQCRMWLAVESSSGEPEPDDFLTLTYISPTPASKRCNARVKPQRMQTLTIHQPRRYPVLRKNSTDSYMGRFDIYHKYSSTAEQTVAPFGSRSPCFSLERYPVTPPSSKLKPPYLPSAYRHQSNLGLIVDCDDWPIFQLLINYTSDRDVIRFNEPFC